MPAAWERGHPVSWLLPNAKKEFALIRRGPVQIGVETADAAPVRVEAATREPSSCLTKKQSFAETVSLLLENIFEKLSQLHFMSSDLQYKSSL